MEVLQIFLAAPRRPPEARCNRLPHLKLVARILVLMSIHLAAVSSETRTLDVLVTRVVDGDTILAIDSNKFEHRVRLAGIDAPEKNQQFSDRSKRSLAALVDKKPVRITWSKVDGYGRLVAIVNLDINANCKSAGCESKFVDVNLEQIHAGLAWHYKQFQSEQTPNDRRAYSVAEEQAREARLGLWSGPEPVAPWNWRQGSAGGPVKKSRSNICHEPSSSSYQSVKNFKSFATLEECIASGGRIPKISAR